MHILQKFEAMRRIVAFDNWPAILFNRVFDRNTGFVAYRKNGLDILVDYRGGDENGTRACIASDMYLKYLPFFNLTGPVRVLDLGANGGGFPLMLRIAGVDLVRSVCVEMNPMTYLRLQLNLATNLGSRALALNAAVCAMAPGTEISVRAARGSVSDSIYSSQSDSSVHSVTVRTTTLEALYDEYFNGEILDICKVDIEHAEYELFASTPDDVLQKIRHLVIELHDKARTPALIERITALGFKEVGLGKEPRTYDNGDVRAYRGLTA